MLKHGKWCSVLSFVNSSMTSLYTCLSGYRGVKFRTEFANIAEVRALAPAGTNLMALTATANPRTRNNVMKSLDMTNTVTVSRLPNNPNIYYAVCLMPSSPMPVMEPIIEELSAKGTGADRVVIFCRSYPNLLNMHETVSLELDSRGQLYISGKGRTSEHRLCDKYDACTALSVRKNIISSFTALDGALRVVLATVSFAMGLDAPNIRKVIHWKPPNGIEEYVQQTGRGGRDGKLAQAVLYYNRKDLSSGKLSEEMKRYISNNEVCRREMLMSYFGDPAQITKPEELHLCCDICEKQCMCSQCTIAESLRSEPFDMAEFADTDCFVPPSPKQPRVERSRVPRVIKDSIKQSIEMYRYELCQQTSDPNAALLVGLELSTGLSDKLITKVVQQSGEISVEQDLEDLGVPKEHACAVLSILQTHL